MDKKELDKYYRSISRSNAAFKKMNRARKRVQLAKDVIKQVELSRFTTSSVYLEVSDTTRILNKDLQKALKKEPTCTVCGIGSIFVCAVDRLDKIKITAPQRDVFVAYLVKMNLFSRFEMELIESAFEGWHQFHVDKGYAYETGDSSKERLVRIMELLIAKKGMAFDQRLFLTRL